MDMNPKRQQGEPGAGHGAGAGNPTTVDTPRLILRQWQYGDYAPFAALNADPQVMQFFPAPLSRLQSDALADKMRKLIDERGWGFWAVELRAAGDAGEKFIGCVGITVCDPILPCHPLVEVGWRLAARFQGRGYAFEAASASLAYGFDTLGLDEIVAFTAALNLRSQKLMRKLGMRPDAQGFEHPAIPAGHPLRPHVLYRIGRAQWLAGRP